MKGYLNWNLNNCKLYSWLFSEEKQKTIIRLRTRGRVCVRMEDRNGLTQLIVSEA